MPGAGSLSAVQTVMRKAPGNGMDLVVFTQGLLVQSALGEKLQGFDPSEATYLGRRTGDLPTPDLRSHGRRQFPGCVLAEPAQVEDR